MGASKSTPFLRLQESELQAISVHALTRAFTRNSVTTLEPVCFVTVAREDFRDSPAASPNFAFNRISTWTN